MSAGALPRTEPGRPAAAADERTRIGVIVATGRGREHQLAVAVKATCSPSAEREHGVLFGIRPLLDEPRGPGWSRLALELVVRGADYLLLTRDDLTPTGSAWYRPAIEATERGVLPTQVERGPEPLFLTARAAVQLFPAPALDELAGDWLRRAAAEFHGWQPASVDGFEFVPTGQPFPTADSRAIKREAGELELELARVERNRQRAADDRRRLEDRLSGRPNV